MIKIIWLRGKYCVVEQSGSGVKVLHRVNTALTADKLAQEARERGRV